MSETKALLKSNRDILAKVNRILMRNASRVMSPEMRGQAFRTAVQAEEAMEVAGLDVYDLSEPAQHIDQARLKVPWRLLPMALANEDVPIRRFERRVEHEFILVLDLSRSMRYPLRKLYAAREEMDLPEQTILLGKPSLLKLVAGVFLNAAMESGFMIRLVMFGQNRINEGERLRPRPGLVSTVFEQIDQWLFRISDRPQKEAPLYDAVVERLARRKGAFLFVGDFIDAVFDWEDLARRQAWFRTLGLFRQWGHHRPILIARVNHSEEVGRRPLGESYASQQRPNECCDRCDRQEEREEEDPDFPPKRTYEDTKHYRARLQRQLAWEQVLSRTLRSCSRGFLSVSDRTSEALFVRSMHRMWLRLLGL